MSNEGTEETKNDTHELLDAAYSAARERIAEEDKKKQEEEKELQRKEKEERDKEEKAWEERVLNTKPKAIWLVAIDGSEDALLAARKCFELAGKDDGIYLIHVIEKKGHLKQGKNEDKEKWEARTKEYYEAALFEGNLQLKRVVELEEKLRQEQEVKEGKGHGDGKTLRRLFITSTIITAEDVREEICKQAQELDVTVVVVGSRGKGKIQRALMGSVST